MTTAPVGYEIDAPRPHELAELTRIEIAAAALFPPEDLSPELREKGLPLSFFENASSAGRLWVARMVEPVTPVGFVEISGGDLGTELRKVMAKEAENGLDPSKRVAMQLDLRTGSGGCLDLRR